MKPQVSVWAVYVRRTDECTVLVRTNDPVEARRIALENTTDAVWTTSEHAAAYPLQGRPDQPVWTPDGWQHPQTDLFKGEQ